MKRLYNKYIPLIFCSVISMFSSCGNKKDEANQNNETQNIYENKDDNKDIPSIRR